jgi:hypothetical protein
VTTAWLVSGGADDDCAGDDACPFLVAGPDGFGEAPVRQALRACANGSKEAGDRAQSLKVAASG